MRPTPHDPSSAAPCLCPPRVPITPGAGSHSCTHPLPTHHPPGCPVPPHPLRIAASRHCFLPSSNPQSHRALGAPSPEQPYGPASTGGTQHWVTHTGGSCGSLMGLLAGRTLQWCPPCDPEAGREVGSQPGTQGPSRGLCPCRGLIAVPVFLSSSPDPSQLPTPHVHSTPAPPPGPSQPISHASMATASSSSSHPRYRTLHFCLFMDPLLLSWRRCQEDGGPVQG